MTKKSEKYYLHPTEEEPVRTCQSKNYIGKVMFLVAMARPRFEANGNEIFSGKIEVFPFVKTVQAQCRTRNRDVGTLEMKPITSVTREIIRACLIEEVIPAITNVWPQENRLNLQLICQPPNSLELNILDLGFFSAIQSLQYKESPRTVEELVHAVVKSFNEYPSQKVNHV
ncbi:hypothetical protein LIER_00903 [Lithospermum erythrorhizon]|uniref:Uncharacterized protein n=1 Tax=Lithospermum erythrorhizon TaxID=34254 RepID=A0AAV3NNI1_LITER